MPTRRKPAAMTADEFRMLLKAAGLTYRPAADVLGVSASSVNEWAQGNTPIGAEKAALIRERLGREKPAS